MIGVLLAAPFAGVLSLVLGGVWWEVRSAGVARVTWYPDSGCETAEVVG